MDIAFIIVFGFCLWWVWDNLSDRKVESVSEFIWLIIFALLGVLAFLFFANPQGLFS